MKPQTRNIAIFLFALIIGVVVMRELFRATDLSIKDLKPFQYRGGANTEKDWYNYVTPLAKVVGKKYGIPWQAIAVQTALETGYGRSSLLRKYNNWGGIKAKPGESSVQMNTLEFINGQMTGISDGFRTWKTPYQGLIGYAQFFHENKRYANALRFPHDPYRFIIEVKAAGYATDPNYVAKLHSMLNEHFIS